MSTEHTPHLNQLVTEEAGISPEVAAAVAEVEQSKQPGWFRKHIFGLSMGAFALAPVVSYAADPNGHIEKQMVQTEAWVVPAGIATEAMWIGGALLMAQGAGVRISKKQWEVRKSWNEIKSTPKDNPTFKTGLALNTVGAVGTAGVAAAGAAMGLPEAAAIPVYGWAAFDLFSTAGIRSGIYVGMKDQTKNLTANQTATAEKSETPKVTVRKARLEDMDRLAELDILLFEKAYGQEVPSQEESKAMLTRRFLNNPDWMFVSEVNGEVEGFVTAFRTNKSVEEFVSWEESTADGTLDGKVDPNGKYVYVANMTIKHEAVELGAEDMLLANLFANGIRDGVEYGYFVARMPYFKRWIEANEVEPTSTEELQQLAEGYMNLRNEDGKRYDKQLSMYEGYGFKLKRLVSEAFEDDASMNYGVVFQAAVPPSEMLKKIKPVRVALGAVLRQVAKNPKLLQKVF